MLCWFQLEGSLKSFHDSSVGDERPIRRARCIKQYCSIGRGHLAVYSVIGSGQLKTESAQSAVIVNKVQLDSLKDN